MLRDIETSRTAADEAPRSGSTTESRTYRIDIPPGTVLLNTNDRMHWAKQARIKKNLKTVAQQLATYQRIPRLKHARISGLLHVPDSRRRDPHNWSLTFKEAVDGIVAAGVLADDSFQYLTDGGIQIGDRRKRLAFSLLIEEVTSC